MYLRVQGVGRIKPRPRKPLAMDAELITVMVVKARVRVITVTTTIIIKS